MRRFLRSFCLFPMPGNSFRAVMSSSLKPGGGITLLEEDLEDEDELARLLVQDAPTMAKVKASPLPSSTSKTTTASTSMSPPPLVTPPVSAKSEMGETMTEESTLAGDLFLEGKNDLDVRRDGLPINYSRQGNQHLAKYTHVRRSIHAKLVKEGAEPVKESTLEWMCTGCRTYNFVGRKLCRRCKQRDVESFKHNSPPARHIPLFPTLWTCHMCGFMNRCEYTNPNNRTKFFCEGCGKRFAGLREWYCPSCNNINSRGSTQCATCYEERPHCWTCSSCKYEGNSVFFTECHSCHSSREKRVSDSTVLCPTCHQRNDVQWEMCFMCMTPLGMMTSVKRLQMRASIDGASDTSLNENNTETPTKCTVITESSLTNSEKSKTLEDDEEKREEGEKAKENMQINEAQPQKQEGGDDTKEVVRNACHENEKPSCDERNSQRGERLPQDVRSLEDGSWWCEKCQVWQRRNVGFCDICLSPKTTATAKILPVQVESEGAAQVGGWTCSVCSHEAGEGTSDKYCKKCQSPKPQEEDVAGGGCGCEDKNILRSSTMTNNDEVMDNVSSSFVDSGEWRCPFCRKMVNVMEVSCCGAPREIPFGYWLCTSCCSTNRDERATCMGCNGPPPEKSWKCSSCLFRNNSQDLICIRCASPHPHHWKCNKCGVKCQQASDLSCGSCGAPKPSHEALICQHCCAPNHVARKSCYRCRTRLSSDKWRCGSCGSSENERLARRCGACCSPREFNMDEVAWICDLCNTAVASGGDLPERLQCPRCGSERTERSLSFQSRWKCQSCGVANAYNIPFCLECGGKRLLEKLHTYATCSSCFHITLLTEDERCKNCGVDLSAIISEAGNSISLSGLSSLLTPTTSSSTSHVTESAPTRGSGIGNAPSIPKMENVSSPSSTSASAKAMERKRDTNGQLDDHNPIPAQDKRMEFSLGGDRTGPSSWSSSPAFLSSKAAVSTLNMSNVNGKLDVGEYLEGDEGEAVVKDGIYAGEEAMKDDEEEEEEEEIDMNSVAWDGNILSWICVNCETTNLEESEMCVSCGLRRGND